jgi:Amt family ammonium transporter
MLTLPLQVDPAVIAEGVNLLWVLVGTFLIFFMHAGFAMLEAGQVRSKNVANQLTKNMLTWSVGVIVFFLVGAAVSTIVGDITGGSAYSVGGAFADTLAPASSNAWVGWLFGAVFAMTAATIVSGAVAGRCKLRAYVAYTILLAAVIYPVVVGFTWAGGMLDALGFHDFAGGMIVHGMGGIAGLTAAWIIGPRLDRFNADGSANVIPGHSVTFAVLGTLILAFGWYGFNVGTQAAVLEVAADGESLVYNGAALGRVALVTTLGMGAGAVAASLMTTYTEGKPDPLFTANGLLAGLVGVTGAVPHVTWWGGIIIGLLAGAQAPLVYRFVVDKLKIDDVCGVFPVHGSAGALGTFLIPVFAVGGFSATQLLMQGVGIAVIALWTIITTVIIFKIADAAVGLNVSEEEELEGLDQGEHGISAYPEFVGNNNPDRALAGVSTDGGVRTDGGKTDE